MAKRIKNNDLAMIENNQTYIDYLDRLQMIATSIFTWKNLDELCGKGSAKALEYYLFNFGKACFVKDSEIGFKIFQCTPADKLNIYYMPTKVNAFSIGYNKIYDFDDIVYIMNNDLQKPTIDSLKLFAYRLYQCERAIDVNLNANKTPILIEGDKDVELTLKNVYMQYDGNTPVIFGNKNFELQNKVNVLKTDAPYLVDKLDTHKHQILFDVLTLLGIKNANTDKKERLVTSEVVSNDQLVNIYLNCWFKTRKQACDEINDKFLQNSEVKVELELNKDIIELLAETNEDIVLGQQTMDKYESIALTSTPKQNQEES